MMNDFSLFYFNSCATKVCIEELKIITSKNNMMRLSILKLPLEKEILLSRRDSYMNYLYCF
jgi:hypothetical protein